VIAILLHILFFWTLHLIFNMFEPSLVQLSASRQELMLSPEPIKLAVNKDVEVVTLQLVDLLV